MLELKNVSKYYYNKGIISSGFSNVSLKFDIGEFVAITGESGSGKSTLLNVISGLDSYEDGEMYINGKETSHYSQKDYEEYRRKYIGNIFQNFNLVNSYTVYQNIELVLLLNGKKRKDVKERVLDIIKEVNLTKYKNTKVSKLSGGQKQRVAIARALAANTPIILADEPTGNLDKESSISVLKLLHKISENKLVIVVTHNYDQISEYATRKITMSDGKILEDKSIKKYSKVKDEVTNEYSDIRWFNKLRLSFRNTFNILPKFLIIFVVYLFVVFSLFSVYSSYEEAKYQNSIYGYNYFFNNSSNKRIVIKKNDKSSFMDEDYDMISSTSNIDYISKNDIIDDQYLSAYNDNDGIYFNGYVRSINDITSVDYGRLPNEDDEVVIAFYKDQLWNEEEYYLDKEIDFEYLHDYVKDKPYYIKIVGLIELNDKNDYSDIFYVSNNLLSKISNKVNVNYTLLKYVFNSSEYESYFGSIYNEILPSDKVSEGIAIIPEEYSYSCKNMNCSKYDLDINVENIYYSDSISLKTSKVYNSKNIEKLTGYSKEYNGAVFINRDEYNSLFDKGYYQSSVYVKDVKKINETKEELNNLGFSTLVMVDTYIKDSELEHFINIAKVISLICLIVVLFFISYFIIKLVLKSRNKYFTTLRILGASYSTTKDLLILELFIISSLSYSVFLLLLILVNKSIIRIEYLKRLTSYISFNGYALLYLIIILMSLLLSNRVSRKLFKDSAMNTYREEV